MSDTSNYDAGQSLVDFTSHDSQQEPRSFSRPSLPGHTRGNGSQSLVDFTTPDDQWTPRNPEYESPSYLGNLARLAGERAVNIVGGGVRFIGQSVDQLGDWLEERIPLGKIDIDDTGISWRPFTKEDVEKESPLLGLARNLENAYFGSEDERLTSWEDVKSTPFSSVLPFAFEQGIISSPDMVAALTNLPAYVAARTGEMGQERARNDAKRDATLGDFLKVAPAAVGSALLERIGASGMLGLGDVAVQGAKQIPGAVAKAGVKEAGTEALQEFGESVATTAGTKEGFDLSQSLERAAQGAVAGGPFGAGVRGGTATFEAIRNRGGAQTPPTGPGVDGSVTPGDVPEGAVPAEDLIGEVEEPPVAPPKRTAPITPEDEASPLSSDKIARGKAIIDDAVAGRQLDINQQDEAPRPAPETVFLPRRPPAIYEPEILQEIPNRQRSGLLSWQQVPAFSRPQPLLPASQAALDPPAPLPRQFRERPVASREGGRETTLNYQGAVPGTPFQRSPAIPPASNAASSAPQASPPLAPALEVRDHGEKSIIVTGQAWKNRKRIGSATGHKPLWNKKAKGFIFPKKREKEVRRALDDLLNPPLPVPAGETSTQQGDTPSPDAQPAAAVGAQTDESEPPTTVAINPRKGRRAPGRSFDNADLLYVIAREGGIRDDGGELLAIFGENPFIPGAGKLIRKNGRSPDYVRELLEEQGWLPEFSGINDLFNLIDEAKMRRVYHPIVEADQQSSDQQRYLLEKEADAVGIEDYQEMSDDDLNEAVRAAFELEAEYQRLEREGIMAEQAITGEDVDIDDIYGPFDPLAYDADAIYGSDIGVDAEVEFGGEVGLDDTQSTEGNDPGAAASIGQDAASNRESREPDGPGDRGREKVSDVRGRPEPEEQSAAQDRGVEGQQGAPATERTDQGEQTLIEGVAPVTDRDRIDAQRDKPMQAKRPQKDADEGLFDTGARGQADLLDAPPAPAPAAAPRSGKREVEGADQPGGSQDATSQDQERGSGVRGDAEAHVSRERKKSRRRVRGEDTRGVQEEDRQADTRISGDEGEVGGGAKKPKIQDFGEKLHGARKDAAQTLGEASEHDVREVPLSKSWPVLDYEALIRDGVEPSVVALVRAVREAIPTKPKNASRAEQWAKNIEALRSASIEAIEGDIVEHEAIDLMYDYLPSMSRAISSRDLYLAVGHGKSLKGIRLSKGKYSVIGGITYSPAKVMWSVERDAKRTSSSNFPDILSMGDTREEAIEKFKSEYDNINTQRNANKQIDFRIYGAKDSDRVSIGKKIGRNIILLKEFDSIQDARKYAKENYDDLVSLLQRAKFSPNERREGNSPRVGVDHRNGSDVTPEQFSETFGFRGVQFGNYVEGKKRQDDLNQAYDALMDMAGILDIPPKAVSLNGELGLAFGARGKGAAGGSAASAHYEVEHVVINLTKKSGAGSLAHEWWHALDNYFSRLRRDADSFMTEKAYHRGEGVRPEMVGAFQSIDKATQQSGIAERSRRLDRTRSTPYWGTGRELTARTFESYMISKLQDQGASNDYLANIISEKAWNDATKGTPGKEDSYPYANIDEIPAIRAAFDEFFRVLETKESGGNVILFQTAEGAFPSFTHQGTRYVLTADMGARAAEVESEIDDIVKSVNPGAKVKVVDRIEDAERGAALGASADMTGTGPVILVAMRYRDRDGNLRDNPDVSRTLNHEVIHDLRRRGLFTKTEEMLLFRGKANRGWQSRFGVDGRYDGYTDADTRAEEAVADAYAAYQAGDMKPSGPISAAFRKVAQFFERLSNWLQRNGFQSAEDVMRRVEAGEVGRREEPQGRTGDSGTRFSIGTPPDGDPGTTAKGGAEVRKSMMMRLIGLQPLDRIIRLPFNFMGGINDQGEWVANRWVSKNAARIIKEAKFDDNGRMSWMNPLLENARMGLSGRLGLTPEYVQRDRQRELDERKIMAEVPELMKMLKGKGIGLSEAKVLQAVLTGEQVPDAEMEKLSEPIRNAIDQLGQEAVELGLLSRESYERNRGSYLHRVYMKHEADQNGLLSWISKMARGSRKKIVGNQFKGRGMFLRVKPGTVVRDTKEFKDRAKDNKRLSWLEKRRDNLLKRLDVAVVQSDERSSEALEHLARRFDLRDRVEKAKRRKADGAETAPTKEQQARAQEQGVSLNRLRRKSEQAHAVIQKIEAQLSDVESEIGGIEDRISSEGDIGVTKGQRFNIYDKISDKTGKVAHRVYIPVGTHLPDRYSGYESRGTWEVRSDEATKGKIILWRDFTKKERTDMGEILDARYTIAKTYMGMAHDLATGRFYRDIAGNPEWATETEPDKGKWVEASGVNRFWQKDQDIEWVHVPDTKIAKSNTKRYGALAGNYVRIEIWRDLNEIDIMQNPTWWNTLLTQWKLNKTARSPVVHMNNVMSNMMLMDLADVRVADLIVGIRSMLKKDKVYQEAIDNGVFGADMMSVEIRNNILKPALEEIEREMQGGQGNIQGRMGALGKLLDRIWRGAKWLDQKGIDAYQFEDEVFRMATYIRKRDLGMPVDLAAQEAREQFLDYDIRAPWVNAARRSVLPFISYTYRAVPVIAQSIVKRPWKLVKYWLVFQALNALVYDFLGDEADEDEERATLREQEQGTLWLTGMDRMMRMPWNDEYDNPVFLDARRWVPAGDLFDIGQANSAIPIPPALMPGGPVMLAAEVILNKSAFTGREIRNVYTDDPADMGRKVAGHLWKSWLPSAPWIPGSWYWEKVGDAMKGARDWQGRPYSLPQALSSSVGVKVRPHDVDAARGFRMRDLQREQRELVAEARRARSDLNRERIDLDEYNDQIDRIRDKLNRVKEKAVALNSAGRK